MVKCEISLFMKTKKGSYIWNFYRMKEIREREIK